MKPKPKKSRPALVTSGLLEPLPTDQQGIEKVIVTKFIGTLSHLRDRHLLNLKRSHGDWPDFIAREGQNDIALELTEVIEPAHGALDTARLKYAKLVKAGMNVLNTDLGDVTVLLFDRNGDPPFPHSNSDAGRTLVEFIVRAIVSEGPRIRALETGQELYVRWADPVVNGARFVGGRSKGASGAPSIGFNRAYTMPVGRSHYFLAEAIKRKAEKSYSKTDGVELWLICYELLWTGSSREAHDKARNLLACSSHPFDEVWYFLPFSVEQSGYLAQIWPANFENLASESQVTS